MIYLQLSENCVTVVILLVLMTEVKCGNFGTKRIVKCKEIAGLNGVVDIKYVETVT